MIFYQIKLNGRYLQGIEPNPLYSRSATAPTMGARHTSSEYKTIWSKEPKEFEPLTAASYIRILFEEFRWGDRKPTDIKLIPIQH